MPIPISRESIIIPTLRAYLETAATDAGFTVDFGAYNEIPMDNPSGGIGYTVIASRGSFQTTFRIDFYLMIQSENKAAALSDSANLLAFYRDSVMDGLRNTGAVGTYQGESVNLFKGIMFDSCNADYILDKAQSKCVWRYVWFDSGFVTGGMQSRWAGLNAPLVSN